jgi:hypothetical protein
MKSRALTFSLPSTLRWPQVFASYAATVPFKEHDTAMVIGAVLMALPGNKHVQGNCPCGYTTMATRRAEAEAKEAKLNPSGQTGAYKLR